MSTANNILNNFITYIINPAMLLLFACGFFVFMWGLVEFMWGLNQGEASNNGKSHMIWGVVGMVIMASVYSIIGIIDSTFSLNATNPDMSRGNTTTLPNNMFGQ